MQAAHAWAPPMASPTRKFRICFVTSIHPDFDARVWRYAVLLADRGHTVHLICPWNVGDGEVREGVVLHPFPRVISRALRTFQGPLRIWRKLRPLLKQVDVVHFHDIDLLPAMTALSFFKPVVYDVHENYPEEVMYSKWIPVPNAMRPLLYHLVRIAQAALAWLIGNVVLVVPEQEKDFPLHSLRSTIMRNYATVALLNRSRDDYRSRPDTVVFIGSNYEANGVLLFLDIATRCLQRLPQVRFIMSTRWAGETIKERALAMVSERNLTNVEFVPNVSPVNVIDHLNRGTIGISADLRVAQRIRALPTKLFEFMAAGLPIIASDLPNSKWVAEESGAVSLCRPEDPDTFVQAIEVLIGDRERAWTIGQKGQQAFREKFCWEKQAPALEAFYSRILGVPNGTAEVPNSRVPHAATGE